MSPGAHLVIAKGHIVIGSKDTLKAFSVEDGGVVFFYQHQFDKKTMDGNDKPLDELLEDVSVASDENHICAIYSDKKVVVINSNTWSVVQTAATNRRPTAVTFHPGSDHILVADKSGGLYKFNVMPSHSEECDVDNKVSLENCDEPSDDLPPILAHVSMLLDVKTDEKYIYTADRDEKIRVSKLDHPYIIESYCLGHTEFVCRVQPLHVAAQSLLLSVSGDSTVRLWDVVTGKELVDLHVMSQIPIESCSPQQKLVPSILSVSSDCASFLLSFNQIASPYVVVFQLDVASIGFTFQEYFQPIGCKRICDVKFSPSNHIYVLAISAESEDLNLQLYARSSGTWRCIDNCSTATRITSELKCFPVDEEEDWELLYKARGDGQVYDSYFKRKAERLLTRKGPGDAQSKRAKVCA